MKIKMLLSAMLVCASFQAQAGFIILEDPSPPPAETASRDTPRVTAAAQEQTGESAPVLAPNSINSASTIKVKGLRPIAGTRKEAVVHKGSRPSSFDDPVSVNGVLSLEDAIAQIVPSDFMVYSSEDVNLSSKVTVSPAKNWVTAVSDMLLPTKYTAVVDWDSKDVVLAIDDQRNKRRAPVPVAAPLPPRQWSVRKTDGLLSEVIARWCTESSAKEGCTKVKWDAAHDLPIEADAVFVGSFDSALSDLLKAVAETSGHQFNHVLHKNGVLMITDGDYRK